MSTAFEAAQAALRKAEASLEADYKSGPKTVLYRQALAPITDQWLQLAAIEAGLNPYASIAEESVR